MTIHVVALDAALPLGDQGWLGLNCPELIGPWAPTGGVVLRADSSLRWGIDGGAWLHRIATDDPALPDSTRRCETVAYAEPGTYLPVGVDFVFTIRWHLSVGAAATDTMILTQWHQTGGSPLMGLYSSGGALTLTVRHGAGGAGETTHLWTSAGPVSGWQEMRIEARIAEPDGMLRLWHQGALVAEYAGPMGNSSRPAPYAKAGLYWWPTDNTWDASQPERTLLVSRVAFGLSESVTYTGGPVLSFLLEDDSGALLLDDGFRLALEADAPYIAAPLVFASPARQVDLVSPDRTQSFTSPARAG